MSHAVVIVLGDTGRSPRMQYHSVSLASMAEIERVTIIGYAGEKCNAVVRTNQKIHDLR
jgi:beta-1,4-mannosyltransferase